MKISNIFEKDEEVLGVMERCLYELIMGELLCTESQ
jgi:hypothetical protein